MLDETSVTESSEKGTDENPHSTAEEVSHVEAMKRWNRAWNKDRENIEAAYNDLKFLAGDQWLEELRIQRETDSRPVMTFNRLPQFSRQVTGDLRKLDPDIKTVPLGGKATEKIAEIRSGMRRYIENRCDAHEFIYPAAADSMVGGGIGHVEVFSEYAEDSTFRQELGVRLLDDQIFVLWDPDAHHPTRRDAMFCFTPVDLSRDAYKDTYPDYSVSDIGTNAMAAQWSTDESVRIARYWYKVKIKRRLMEMPNGGFEDLTREEDDDIARMEEEGGKIIVRNGHQVRWVMMNGVEFITKPKDWDGRFIPVVPFIGEEVRIGARIVRHGAIRFALDPQIAHNYYESTQAEVIGLQPKSSFIGTETNFRKNKAQWDIANLKNFSALEYTPDPLNGGREPSRSPPPLSSSGVSEASASALQAMQACIGIYNASLGARSNETSGVAIRSREQQGDTGTFLYVKNYGLSLKHIARVIDDLIPHLYDTTQMARIIGIDNSERLEVINQPQGVSVDGVPIEILNDLTVGSYDVSMELGPSYQTRREEARAGMTDFVSAFPAAAPVLAPVLADMQDWPNKELIRDLLTTLAPPSVQAILAQKNNEPPPPPMPPNPAQQLEAQVMQAKAQGEMAKAEGEKIRAMSIEARAEFELKDQELKLRGQELANIKSEFELLDAQMKLGMNGPPLDSAKLHTWIGQVDMALQHLDQHVANQIAGLTSFGESSEGVAGAPMSEGPPVATGPATPAIPGTVEGLGGAPGGLEPEPVAMPPSLPLGDYAALPEER